MKRCLLLVIFLFLLLPLTNFNYVKSGASDYTITENSVIDTVFFESNPYFSDFESSIVSSKIISDISKEYEFGYSSTDEIMGLEPPSIINFDVLPQVYPQTYFSLNVTITDIMGISEIIDVTIELSHDVILYWTNENDAFGIKSDPNNYCIVASNNSSKRIFSEAVCELSWCIKLNWDYPSGNVDIIENNTRVRSNYERYSVANNKNIFNFNSDLEVYINTSDIEVQPTELFSVVGTVYHKDTLIPPVSGTAAANFDGSTSQVKVVDCPPFHESNFSIEAWIKLDNFSSYVCPIVGRGSNDSGYNFWVGGNNFASGRLILNGGYGVQAVSSSIRIDLGVWTHVAVVWDGEKVIFYKNGVSEICSGFSFQINNSLPTIIGHEKWAFANFFNGSIDELKIFNRVLNSSEISSNVFGVSVNLDDLVLYLPFDGDCIDISGLRNNCIPQNLAFTDGFAKVKITISLNQIVKGQTTLVNSQSGEFIIPYVLAEKFGGEYKYVVFVSDNLSPISQKNNVTVTVKTPLWLESLFEWIITHNSYLIFCFLIFILSIILLTIAVLKDFSAKKFIY